MSVSLDKTPRVSLIKRNADGRHKTDQERNAPRIDTRKHTTARGR